jgi:Tfp pilus assembly pilus retraction ATPase PilT
VIDTGRKAGMCTMLDSVNELLDENLITPETAIRVLVSYT